MGNTRILTPDTMASFHDRSSTFEVTPELLSQLDTYERWLFQPDDTECCEPAPFGWSLTEYEDLCELVIQAMKNLPSK